MRPCLGNVSMIATLVMTLGLVAPQALRGEANSKSLVLLDEVGTGTEPVSICTVARDP